MQKKKVYPALCANMGSWFPYYIIRMSLEQIVREVTLVDTAEDDGILDDILQRPYKKLRVENSIAPFLSRPDRFFPAIVVAALGGDAKFRPLKLQYTREQEYWKKQGGDDAFGLLTFRGDQVYYALDGQHRLGALRQVVNDVDNPPSPDFLKEHVSVLVICRKENDAEFLKSYRRLFTSLNRYTVKTDEDVNIAMDEDDAFAIITRRLILEHGFFKATESEGKRVQTFGKNIANSSLSSCFTSLRTLYGMNVELLCSNERIKELDWNSKKKLDAFKSERPGDQAISEFYNEAALYWDALVEALPELSDPPAKRRDHKAEDMDHVMFWPLGQEVIIAAIRRLLDRKLKDNKPTPENVKAALKPLTRMDLRLHANPWRNILLVQERGGEKNPWTMRSGDRQPAQDVAQRLAEWFLGVSCLNSKEVEDLKVRWESMLSPKQDKKAVEKMWEEIIEQKKNCSS